MCAAINIGQKRNLGHCSFRFNIITRASAATGPETMGYRKTAVKKDIVEMTSSICVFLCCFNVQNAPNNIISRTPTLQSNTI